MLHLYVHPRNSKQRSKVNFANEWLTDTQLASIGTYAAVVRHAEFALQTGTPVRVHVRATPSSPARICCECRVQRIERKDPLSGGRSGFRVYFNRHRELNIPRTKKLQRGWYLADPSSYEPARQ